MLYTEKLSTSNLPFISIYPFHEFAESVKRRCKCKAIAPWPDVSDVVTSHLVDPVSLHRCLSRQDIHIYIYIHYNFLQPTTSQITPTFNQSWTPSRIDLNSWSDQIKSTQMRRNYTREAKFNTLFKSQASQVDWLGRSLIAHDINEVPENGVCRSLWKHHQNLLMSER